MAAIGPTLETPRLILRPPVQDDLDGFATMAADAETMRFIGGVAPRHGAWRGLAIVTGSWSLLGYSMFSVIEKDTGQWIGRLGPWYPGGETGGWPGPEVGWGLVASAQGKGYAFEGATAALDWVFESLGWTEVVHCIHKENLASIRLAERLGSHRIREDVPLPKPFNEVVDVYGQRRDEWRRRTTIG